MTGGGSGINLAIAKRFASQGANVSIIGRTKEKLDKALGGIKDMGGTPDLLFVIGARLGEMTKAMSTIRALPQFANASVSGAFDPSPAAFISRNSGDSSS